MKIVKKKNQLKIVIFTAVKNRCISHGRVFVMWFCFVIYIKVISLETPHCECSAQKINRHLITLLYD